MAIYITGDTHGDFQRWPAETDAAKFHEESRSLFQSAGWDLQPGGDSTSDTVTKGWQELYCIR